LKKGVFPKGWKAAKALNPTSPHYSRMSLSQRHRPL
jgi:hypothetical protein